MGLPIAAVDALPQLYRHVSFGPLASLAKSECSACKARTGAGNLLGVPELASASGRTSWAIAPCSLTLSPPDLVWPALHRADCSP